jgi:DNA-directed RNA polymerase alpha subunit
MKFEWEQINIWDAENNNLGTQSHRSKTIGGWLVKSYTFFNSKREARICESMVFVPDPHHEWNIADEDEILDESIETLNIFVRTRHCLRAGDIHIIRDVLKYTESDLLKLTNFGKKSLVDLKAALGEKKLSLRVT